MLLQQFVTISLLCQIGVVMSARSPNILLIVADDLGFNDVSWHNSDIYSPNLEILATNGIILENYYVQPICTPTRAALMTGYYPIHTGRQHSVLWPQEPRGLFTNFTLMPEYLKKLGYKTHIVGKWHLGFCNEKYLPTRRGFDSFYGFYTGSEDYYTHRRSTSAEGGQPGYDFRDNDKVDLNATGIYSSYLLAEHSVRLIMDHSINHPKDPLFLYLPFQDVHSPLQVPEKYLKIYPNIKNTNRKVYSGKVSALDDAVGRVVAALKISGLFNNTIIIFTSDNGGQTSSGGNNYPLRGNKGTLWEGGTRAVGFIYSSKFRNQGSIFNGLMHVTDWLPTLMSASGLEQNLRRRITQKMDGLDIWNSIVNLQESPRKEMVYNIDPYNGDNKFGTKHRTKNAAIRVGKMKLILGDPGTPDGWIPPPTARKLKGMLMPSSPPSMDYSIHNQTHKVRLFDLSVDPFEQVNLAPRNGNLVQKLLTKLSVYESTMIPPDVVAEIPAGNPNRFSGYWSTGWCSARPNKVSSFNDV